MRDTLKPLLLILVTAYAAGSPILDAVRPHALDEPLRGFHKDVAAMGRAGMQVARAVAMTSPHDIVATGTVSGRLMGDVTYSLGRVSAGR